MGAVLRYRSGDPFTLPVSIAEPSSILSGSPKTISFRCGGRHGGQASLGACRMRSAGDLQGRGPPRQGSVSPWGDDARWIEGQFYSGDHFPTGRVGSGHPTHRPDAQTVGQKPFFLTGLQQGPVTRLGTCGLARIVAIEKQWHRAVETSVGQGRQCDQRFDPMVGADVANHVDIASDPAGGHRDKRSVPDKPTAIARGIQFGAGPGRRCRFPIS